MPGRDISSRRRRLPDVVWSAAAGASLLVFLVRNPFLFSKKMYAWGDFAANAFLIDRALHWRLLVGNYSRVGFHRPGPALLYVQAWSQWLFYNVLGVVPTPYNARTGNGRRNCAFPCSGTSVRPSGLAHSAGPAMVPISQPIGSTMSVVGMPSARETVFKS